MLILFYIFIITYSDKHFNQKAKELLGDQAALLLFLFFKRRENEKVRVVLVVVWLYNTTFFAIFQFANYTKIINLPHCFCATFTTTLFSFPFSV